VIAVTPEYASSRAEQAVPADDGYRRATHLLWYRAVVAALLLIISIYFYFQPLPFLQRTVLLSVAVAFVLFVPLQWLMLRSSLALPVQLGIYFLADLLLVSGLVFSTGGVASPFAFVYGLIIVAAGTQATALLILSTSIAACGSYLFTVYLHFWLLARQAPLPVDTLAILLQTSAFLLVGGVIAAIARRQEMLQESRKQAIRQHANLQELHGQMIDTMQEGMLVLDQKLVIRESNLAAQQMLAGDHRLQGKLLTEFIMLPARLKRYFLRPRQFSCKCEYEKDGQTCMLTAVPMRHGNDLSVWLLSIVDVTELRKLEHELAAQDKLAALGRMTAILAHEIRNPLQTIGQAVELIPRGGEPQEQEMCSIVLQEVQRLDRLLSDMLDYTQPLRPSPRDSNISDLMEHAIRQVDIQGVMGIRWHSDFPALRLDADHFRLLLDNLLRNAVRASPRPGSVSLGLLSDGMQGWRLEVTDKGSGVPANIQPHLFEPFVSGQPEGCGLGLATVWQVCQSNNWRIEFSSSGKGTRFVVTAQAVPGVESKQPQNLAEA